MPADSDLQVGCYASVFLTLSRSFGAGVFFAYWPRKKNPCQRQGFLGGTDSGVFPCFDPELLIRTPHNINDMGHFLELLVLRGATSTVLSAVTYVRDDKESQRVEWGPCLVWRCYSLLKLGEEVVPWELLVD